MLLWDLIPYPGQRNQLTGGKYLFYTLLNQPNCIFVVFSGYGMFDGIK